MLDPTLDDDRGHPIGTNMIRGLLANVVLCAHERKVTIDFMIDLLNSCSDCHLLLSNMDSALRMKLALSKLDPTRQPPILNDEIDKIEARIDQVRTVLLEKMKLVAQCAPPGAPIS